MFNTVNPGQNQLQIRVSDAKWSVQVVSTVNVNVIGINDDTLDTSGSIRFQGKSGYHYTP